MTAIIDEDFLPADIDAIKTIRVAVATDKRTGKQGVLAVTTVDNKGRAVGSAPMIWADNARTERYMEMVRKTASGVQNARIEVREFHASQEPGELVKA